ncbi:WbqC family protein [Formosa maritima]|uniref:WbqC family protein n=1 Tax=Formosa maritima TaxID=2592046 RepID=A0A5D0GEA5_9FLAO|nr:WbqC family protein [Formosa maritima]TYA56639.1 WbqC family protein [Formosa maritima]
MKVAIMQPYFMPYLGYIAIINYVDEFILFDTPQFIRHGWIERNKVLKLDGDTMYIKVPLVKHARNTTIENVIINNNLSWKHKIISQLDHYKKRAPYYKNVIALLHEIFDEEYSSIVSLNYKSLQILCRYLGIITPISIWSEMKVEIDEVKAPDEWALHICKALKYDTYVNLPGGRSFFDVQKYEREGISLSFLELEPTQYKQFSNVFVPFLSIIDVLMFNDVSQVKEMLKNFNLK